MSAAEQGAGPEPADERSRLAVLATGVPLLLFTAPCFLPFEHDRSLFQDARRDLGALAILALIFCWPVLVSAVGFWRARGKSPPGKVAFGVPAVAYVMAASLGLALVAMALFGQSAARGEPGLFATALAWVGVLLMLGRGVIRAGWERWIALVAAIWLFHAGVVLLMATGRQGAVTVPSAAVWVVLFALSASVAPLGWAMTRRKA